MRRLVSLVFLLCALSVPVLVRTQTALFQFGDARPDHGWFQLTDPVSQPKLVGAFFDGTTFELNPTIDIATVTGADSDVDTVFRAHGSGIKAEIAKILNASLASSGQSVRIECLSGLSIDQLRDGYRQLPLRDGAQVVVNSLSVDSVTVHAADQNGNDTNASIDVDALTSAVRSLVSKHSFPVTNAPQSLPSPTVTLATSPPLTCPTPSPASSSSAAPSKAASEEAPLQPASQNAPSPTATTAVSASPMTSPAPGATPGSSSPVLVSLGSQSSSATIRDLKAAHVVTALRMVQVVQQGKLQKHAITFDDSNPFSSTNTDTQVPRFALAIQPIEEPNENFGRECVNVVLTNLNDSVIGAPSEATVMTCPTNVSLVSDPSGIPAPLFVPTPSPSLQNNSLNQMPLREVRQTDALTSFVSSCSVNISNLHFTFRAARPGEYKKPPNIPVVLNSVRGTAQVTETPFRVTLTTVYQFH